MWGVFLIVFMSVLILISIQVVELFILMVYVEGGKVNVGSVMGVFYSLEEMFMEMVLVELIVKIDVEGKVIFVFENFFLGEYVVMVFYDENENGEFDIGFFGILKEKVGFLNNVCGRMGFVLYEKVKFILLFMFIEIMIFLISVDGDQCCLQVLDDC